MLACLFVGVFAIVDIAVGWFGLDNALVSLCVWNAASKNHALDLLS
jgi:hypothetical protein